MRIKNILTLFALATLIMTGCGKKSHGLKKIAEGAAEIVADDDEKPSEEPRKDNEKAPSLDDMRWIRNKDYHFSYPQCFTKSEEFVDDIPADVTTYEYEDIELCLWPLLGNWATFTDEYPVEGSVLSTDARISKTTYTSRTGIYSGYTDDGRIFYMKVLISGGEVNHAHSLVLIYPKSRQDEVGSLINEVKDWKLPYTK